MANNPFDKVYLDSAMLDTVAAGGSVSTGSDTYTADEDAIYMIPEDIGDLVQTTGTSTSDVMSQKAVTDALTNKVDKVTTTSTYNRLYYIGTNGTQGTMNVDSAATPNAVARRLSTSQILVPETPTDNAHAASKKYVDDRVAANPSGTATTNLTKLQVGSTVYGISSGGTYYRHNIGVFNSNNSEGSLEIHYYFISSSSTPITLSTLMNYDLDTFSYSGNSVLGGYPIIAFMGSPIIADGFVDIRGFAMQDQYGTVRYFRIEDGTTTVTDTVNAL